MKMPRKAGNDSSSSALPMVDNAADCNCSEKSMSGFLVTLIAITAVIAVNTVLRGPRWDAVWTAFGAKNHGYQPQEVAMGQQGSFVRKDYPIDDLLPTGFDKKSCYSRFESAWYRRGVLKKASPDLVSRLRRYEALHKKCGPYTESYNKTVEDLKLGRSPTASDCKYVVWLPFNGLGNRIISIASSFLYALLTDRVLLLDRGFDIPDLFCEPYPGTSWILPSNFPLADRYNNFNKRSQESYGNKLRSNSFSNSTDSHMFVYLGDDYEDSDRLFYCNQDQMHLQNTAWVIIKSDIYFVPYLFLIPHFEQELNKLFPDKEAVFHLLSRYLFHPTNSAWGFITRYYKTYLSKADVKVGIQARVVDSRLSPMNNVLDQILSCTVKENILPEVSWEERNADNDSSRKPKTIAVLITSLYSAFSDEIRKKYLEHPTATGELISVHQPTHEEYQQTDKQGHNKKAWIEMYLLSLTDKLVTSPGSTFGYVAQGLGGLEPWVLSRFVKQKTVPYPSCQRDSSMEPCFFSPYYDCRLKKNVDTSILPNVKKCVDASWGFKMVQSHDQP